MTYEEKLDKLVCRLLEERQMTRKGHSTQVSFSHGSFTKLAFVDVVKICLQLQDDEDILKIVNAYQDIDQHDPFDEPTTTNYLHSDTITVEYGNKFDEWYEKRLLDKKGSLDQLTYLNLVKILDVVLDIDQELQIYGVPTVNIVALPQVVRFSELCRSNDRVSVKTYEQHRWDGAMYLKSKGIISSLESVDVDFGFGYMKIKVNLLPFNDFYKKIEAEYNKRNNQQGTTTPQPQTLVSESGSTPTWSDSFKWLSDKKYSFGQYGSIEFTSHDRLHIFKTLVDKQGGWAKVKELAGNKDDKFVRTTIKQIEDRLPKEAKDVIKIVPTTDDDLPNKPNEGAYRIRYSPKT